MTRTLPSEEMSRLLAIYRDHVLPLKTRQVKLLGRKCQPVLMKTLLGFELQLGRKRITCPDMITARYLRVFAELGVKTIQIPYDPTRTGLILTELEESFANMKQVVKEGVAGERAPRRHVQRVYGKIRAGLVKSESEILES